MNLIAKVSGEILALLCRCYDNLLKIILSHAVDTRYGLEAWVFGFFFLFYSSISNLNSSQLLECFGRFLCAILFL